MSYKPPVTEDDFEAIFLGVSYIHHLVIEHISKRIKMGDPHIPVDRIEYWDDFQLHHNGSTGNYVNLSREGNQFSIPFKEILSNEPELAYIVNRNRARATITTIQKHLQTGECAKNDLIKLYSMRAWFGAGFSSLVHTIMNIIENCGKDITPGFASLIYDDLQWLYAIPKMSRDQAGCIRNGLKSAGMRVENQALRDAIIEAVEDAECPNT